MLNYQFYIADYRGDSLSEDDFPRLCRRASEQLARYKRLYSVMGT